MIRSRYLMTLMVAVILLPVTATVAQQRFTAHIGYVFPAGGKQGTQFEVKIGGQFLDGVNEIHVSGNGVKATLVEYFKPLTQGQFNAMREQLSQMMDRKQAVMKSKRPGGPTTKATWTDEDEKKVMEIRKRLSTFVRRPSSPAIAETATIQVTIAADAEPGAREIRVGSAAWMSNPLVFCVGQLPEFSHRACAPGDLREGGAPGGGVGTREVNVTTPVTVNGQILPSAIDRFRFKAKKGEKLVMIASARDLIPYIPDAVPGWFQATLTLYDGNKKEVAYDDDFRFNPDPVLYYEVPRDGEYVLEIKDSIFRGREDFVYRIAIGELPYITGIWPMGGKVGTQTTVDLKGWNLPVAKMTLEPKTAGIMPVSVGGKGWVSNKAPFCADALADCAEQEPNNDPSTAQAISPPMIVNGKIGQPGDWDVYKIEGKADREIVIEVNARHLGSPMDSIVRLTDASGKQIAINDDNEDKGAGLTTHHADSRMTVNLPASGTYFVHVGDAQNQGGPEYGYRLRISPRRPDFELRLVPSSIVVRGGATIPVTIYAIRKDGFSGDIALSLKNAPAGFVLSGAKVPGNQEEVRLTLTAPPAPPRDPVSLQVEGKAMVQGMEVTRQAVPSESMMQAFAYHHLVPSSELVVAVSGKFGGKNVMKVLTPLPLRIPAGGSAKVVATVPGNTFFGKVEMELSEPPAGITIGSCTPTRDGMEITVKAERGKAMPGLKGNLIVTAFSQRGGGATDKSKAPARRIPLGTLPAIPFEVVPR